MNSANNDPFQAHPAAEETWFLETEPFSLQGFDIVSPRGPEEVFIKLFALQAAFLRGEQIQVDMDFDHTLSDPFADSTWKASASALKGKLEKSSNIERTKCLRMQEMGLLTLDKESSWSCHELQRHVMNGTTEDELTLAAATIPLRVGAFRLFQMFDVYPQLFPVIVSGGIGNMIDKVLELHRIRMPSDQVLANRFVPYIGDEAGTFPDSSEILGSGNKLPNIIARFPSVNENRCHTIALGDSVTDAAMSFNGLAIRTGQPFGNDQTYLENSAAAGFDLVLRTSGLLAVSELLEQIVDIVNQDKNM